MQNQTVEDSEDCVSSEQQQEKDCFSSNLFFYSSLFFMALALPFSVFLVFGKLANCTLALLSYFKFSSLD